MVIHSDSEVGLVVAVLVTMAGVFLPLFIAAIFASERNYRAAAKVILGALGALAGWVVIVGLASAVTPRSIVKLGDSYCVDITCIGIDRVSKEMRKSQTVYRLDVHLFSDANTVKVSFGDVSFFLQDERGQRFPMVEDPLAVPYDTYLDPGQTIKTTLTFTVASNARELFLRQGPRIPASAAKPGSIGGGKAPAWARFVGVWFYLAWLGNDSHPFHRATVMRVL